MNHLSTQPGSHIHSHSLPALACLAGVTLSATGLLRSSDLAPKLFFAVLSILSTLGYLCVKCNASLLFSVEAVIFRRLLRPGGPDLMKVRPTTCQSIDSALQHTIKQSVLQNELDMDILSRESQNLFLTIATSLAGPDRSNWAPIVEDIDSAVS